MVSIVTIGTSDGWPPPLRAGANQVPQVSLTAVGCFDVNHDGTIDTRSGLEGGDAKLLLPSHAIDLPRFARPAPTAPGTTDTRARSTSCASRSAALDDAVAMYRHYGDVIPTQPAPPTISPSPTPNASKAQSLPTQ
jgi:hypothetical protein